MDSIQNFLGFRKQLEVEREAIQQRIREIDAALGGSHVGNGLTTALPRRGRPPGSKNKVKAVSVTGPRDKGNGRTMTLRERMTLATAKKPLSVREMVEALKQQGHVFESADPVKRLGAWLYGNKGKAHFQRKDGKFWPRKG